MNANIKLEGPSDLYAALLEVKNGRADGGTRGCVQLTKAAAKAAGIPWDFVVSSVEILGLKMSNRSGRHGHIISL